MIKQAKKITKKIIFLGLAGLLVFGSCFSHNKINSYASESYEDLSNSTLYDICLFVGCYSASSFGIGYDYEDMDEIAELGKSVIDSTDINDAGWFVGSHSSTADYVYGEDVLEQIKNTEWSNIQNSEHSGIDSTCYYFTKSGNSLFSDSISSIYDKWVNKQGCFLDTKFGPYDTLMADKFSGYQTNENGYYYGTIVYEVNNETHMEVLYATGPFVALYSSDATFTATTGGGGVFLNNNSNKYYILKFHEDPTLDRDTFSVINADLPYYTDLDIKNDALRTGNFELALNYSDYNVVPDLYVDGNFVLNDNIEHISTSLYYLDDFYNFTKDVTSTTLEYKQSSDSYNNLLETNLAGMDSLGDSISNPIYYPSSSSSPELEENEFPNYVNPDIPNDDGNSNKLLIYFDSSEMFVYTNGILSLLMPVVYILGGFSLGFILLYTLKSVFG